MKYSGFILALILFTANSFAQDPLTNRKDSASYAIGMQFGGSLNQMGADQEALNMDLLYQGIVDMLKKNDSTILGINESRSLAQSFVQQIQLAMSEKAEKRAAAFLIENGKKEGVFTLESGMQYKVITNGPLGVSPAPSQKVRVHYEGRLQDGTIFDSSYQRAKPMVFGVSQVIKGWTEALQLMKPGDKWQLYIPPALAYGRRGSPPKIGPNELLIFDVELIEVMGE